MPTPAPSLPARAISELLGTFILILFGNGSVVTEVLYNHFLGGKDVNVLSINIAYGLGVTFGVYTAFKSGGHLNPAVTITEMVFNFKNFKPVTGIVYILSQFLGAILASFVLHMNYYAGFEQFLELQNSNGTKLPNGKDIFNPICGPGQNTKENGDALLAVAGTFATFPHASINTSSRFFIAYFDQILGTFILLFLIKAVTAKNSPNQASPQTAPLIIGLIVVVIGQALGVNCGYAINPARDLGPRIYLAMAGFSNVFGCEGLASPYWVVPVFATTIGALLGVLFFNLALGEDGWNGQGDNEDTDDYEDERKQLNA